jgi:hypothetical protein
MNRGSFTSRGFKDHKYVLRRSPLFNEAVGELLKATGCSHNFFDFEVAGGKITNGLTTLNQVCEPLFQMRKVC